MRTAKALKNVVILLGVIVLVLGTYFVYRYKTKHALDQGRKAIHEKSNAVILKWTDQSPSQLYQAIMNVALELDKPVLPKVKIILEKSKSEEVRAAAAFALSFQKDKESQEAVEHISSHAEGLVATHLIKAARQELNPRHVDSLRSLLFIKSLTDADRSLAEATLYLTSPDPKERKQQLNLMISGAKKGGPGSAFYIEELNQVASDHGEVLDIDRKLLKTSQEGWLISLAIRALAVSRDPELKKTLEHWVHHSNVLVQKAAMDSFISLCPEERWTWINEGYDHAQEEAMKADWLRVAFQLGGPQAKVFFERVKGNPYLNELKTRSLKEECQ